MKPHIHNLTKHGACQRAIQFASNYDTFQEVVNNCERADWLHWALRMLPQRERVKAACYIVRNTPTKNGTVWDLLTDERSRKAIEVAEAFAEGKATLDEVRAAADAADAAADAAAFTAAFAAAFAAADAADAAAFAADAADAAFAAAFAADAADAAADAFQTNYIRSLDWSFMDVVTESEVTP